MRIERTKLPGVLLVTPDRFGDERGYLQELLNEHYNYSSDYAFYSVSERGVVRGLHYQDGLWKLVSVLKGKIFEVAFDKDTGDWQGFELSADNGQQLLIPPTYAAGFQCMEDDTIYLNLLSDQYNPGTESGFNPSVIDWPLKKQIISKKDQEAPHKSANHRL